LKALETWPLWDRPPTFIIRTAILVSRVPEPSQMINFAEH